jgi:neutral ceramidase
MAMTRRRRWAVSGIIAVAALGLVYGAASWDRCGEWRASPPGLTAVARGSGPLKVGAAKVALQPRLPMTVGGYGPWRSTADGVHGQLFARAVVLDVGGQRFGLVSLETLLVPRPLVLKLREGRAFPVWVVATHTHSSVSGYDRRLTAELAALGTFDETSEAALIAAGKAALDDALKALVPATLEVGTAEVPGLAVARSSSGPDQRLSAAQFRDERGALKAAWLIAAAHPTLVERRTTHLDADWPGRLAAEEEKDGAVVVLLQGAGGNASAALEPQETLEGFARRMGAAFHGLTMSARLDSVDLGYASAELQLPHPDGTRLVPAVLLGATENVLCAGAEHDLELAALRLGPLTLLATPVEPTGYAGRILEAKAGVHRAIGLTNGYVGYVDTEDAVRERWGESGRQYFSPDFLQLLADAAALVGPALGTSTVR